MAASCCERSDRLCCASRGRGFKNRVVAPMAASRGGFSCVEKPLVLSPSCFSIMRPSIWSAAGAERCCARPLTPSCVVLRRVPENMFIIGGTCAHTMRQCVGGTCAVQIFASAISARRHVDSGRRQVHCRGREVPARDQRSGGAAALRGAAPPRPEPERERIHCRASARP